MNIATTIKEAMSGWDTIITAARAQFPKASEDELYEIAKSAMLRALGVPQ